jgi:hypothetical protein
MPLNRRKFATIPQQRCNVRALERPRQAMSEDEPMKAREFSITWLVAILPAVALVWPMWT